MYPNSAAARKSAYKVGSLRSNGTSPQPGGRISRIMIVSAAFLVVAGGILAGPRMASAATTAEMLTDISIAVNGASPGSLADVDGTLFFNGEDNNDNSQLWRSDGTAAGTFMLTSYSDPSFNPTQLTNVDGTLFFTADNGQQLWKSDGTAAGTVMVDQPISQNTGAN